MKTLIVTLMLAFVPMAALAKTTPAAAPSTAYDYSFSTPEGGDMPLSAYRRKVLLVVNTATLCGFAPQFAGLQKLHEEYGDKGLVIIGVPSNDFGGQEPGESKDVAKAVRDSYGVTFPLTAKATVAGDGAHPFYVWAGQAQGTGFFTAKPRWNFHKYLIGRDGKVAGSFASWNEPQGDEVVKAVKAALAEGAPDAAQ